MLCVLNPSQQVRGLMRHQTMYIPIQFLVGHKRLRTDCVMLFAHGAMRLIVLAVGGIVHGWSCAF
jgi:hypothetical protein